jgi:two-component system KDP operon response regulator KdpE
MNATILPPLFSVLIVDDDPMFRKGLAASLKTSGYSVELARNAEEALHYVRERPVDIVLLDINMPEIGGLEACQRIRALAPQSGILMLTVRDAEDDKVQALGAGADDYVTKPFQLRELIARMGAVLRRLGSGPELNTPVIRVGRLELELEHRVLRKAGKEIHLSPKEFQLLAFLMQHKDVPVTHVRLLRAVWGHEYGNEPNHLRSYVKTLRRKIEDDPGQPQYILTEPWVGYRLRDPHDPNSPAAEPAPAPVDDDL